MEKLKERITENGIDYILVGDYYIPDLKLPEENRPIGRYGRLHREYLKQEHPARYSSLNELEQAGMIMRVRQGIGEVSHIYILLPKEDTAHE